MVTVKLDGKGWARGRNGSFTPAEIDVEDIGSGKGKNLDVAVRSARSWGTSPIMLEISPADAIAVGRMLIDEASKKIKEAGSDRESNHDTEDDPERADDACSVAPVSVEGDN